MGVRLDCPRQPWWTHRVNAKAARYLPFWSCGSKDRGLSSPQAQYKGSSQTVGISGIPAGAGLLSTWGGTSGRTVPAWLLGGAWVLEEVRIFPWLCRRSPTKPRNNVNIQEKLSIYILLLLMVGVGLGWSQHGSR